MPTDGLVAWYPFDSSIEDESVNSFNLCTNSISYTDGRHGDVGGAFLGVYGGDLLTSCSPNDSWTDEISYALWFQPFNLESDPYPSGWFALITMDGWNHDSFGTLISDFGEECETGHIRVRPSWPNNQSFADCGEIDTGHWHHLCVTGNEESSSVFLDGELLFSSQHSAETTFTEVPFEWTVGASARSHTYQFKGAIDEVGIWNRALTEEEILALYNAPAPAPGCTDPAACNFDSEATSDDGSCIYPPFVELGEDIATCEDSVILDAGEGFTYYEWNTGDTSRNILVHEAGEYSVITSNSVANEYALQFNGIDASAQFEESILFGVESFSVSVDCRLNAFAGNDSEPYSYIIGHPLTGGTNDHGFKIHTASNSLNGGFQVHINDEGTTHFNVISFDNSVESKVELDQWYDLTMVVDRDNALFSFYVDGVLVEAQTIHSDFGNLDHPNGLSLGIQSIHQTSLLNGYLDNLQVWDIALSAEQVAQFQTTVPSGNEEELVGFWDFEEGEGNEANEVNGSASSILLNNVEWTDDDLHSMFDFSCSAEDSIQVSFLVTGCVNPEACNYAEDALCDDGSCIPSGCMEAEACNYNALAECEGEACDYTCCPGPGCCSAGMYWDYDLEQCLNYETCQEDLDGDGVIGINDLMQLLSSFGTMCEET